MSITFQKEKVTAKLTLEVRDLYAPWWEESDFHTKLGVDYKPLLSQFLTLGDSVIAVTGRDEQGNLKYVYAAVVTPYVYNPFVTYAQECVWCVEKGGSSVRGLLQFLEAIEKTLKEAEVDIFSLVVPNKYLTETKSKFFKKLGFIEMDTVMFKEVTHG